ncbi:enoyl-CoA hydratase-related protein [uncultured Pseudokineococcus sp.]|uniref:enoyl-CoA hydratase/isomerase family protein n=1 Tax=uncultured Pseudokineococcus sp. TaxID=1642928 RepID=UPI0034389871
MEPPVRGVAVLRLDRPPVNALDAAAQDLVAALAREADGRQDVRAVVVTGGERFGAGADVHEMAAMSGEEMAARAPGLQGFTDAVAAVGVPVVAALEGPVLGGGLELALACDVRVCGEGARLGLPEVGLGVVPGAGGTQRLARLVGPARAKDLLLSASPVGAQESWRLGLVDRVVPAGEALGAARALAERYAAAGPREALRAAKRAVDGGLELPLPQGLALERALFTELFAGPERARRMGAFAVRRPGTGAVPGDHRRT